MLGTSLLRCYEQGGRRLRGTGHRQPSVVQRHIVVYQNGRQRARAAQDGRKCPLECEPSRAALWGDIRQVPLDQQVAQAAEGAAANEVGEQLKLCALRGRYNAEREEREIVVGDCGKGTCGA